MARRSNRCFVCGHQATRSVSIDGRSAPLCDDCPSQQEIYQRAAALRDGWPSWRWRIGHADELHGAPVCFDQVHAVPPDSGVLDVPLT